MPLARIRITRVFCRLRWSANGRRTCLPEMRFTRSLQDHDAPWFQMCRLLELNTASRLRTIFASRKLKFTDLLAAIGSDEIARRRAKLGVAV